MKSGQNVWRLGFRLRKGASGGAPVAPWRTPGAPWPGPRQNGAGQLVTNQLHPSPWRSTSPLSRTAASPPFLRFRIGCISLLLALALHEERLQKALRSQNGPLCDLSATKLHHRRRMVSAERTRFCWRTWLTGGLLSSVRTEHSQLHHLDCPSFPSCPSMPPCTVQAATHQRKLLIWDLP
jgi:hypothetical protein